MPHILSLFIIFISFFDMFLLTNDILSVNIKKIKFLNIWRINMNKKYSENKLIVFTRYLILFMLVSGVVVLITLPFTLNMCKKYDYNGLSKHFYPILTIIAFCGVMALLILWQLKKIFDTVISNDCFVNENVKSLNKMSIYSILISIAMFIRIFIKPTLASAAMVLTFLIASLFSRILATVFESAIAYKTENDFTI